MATDFNAGAGTVTVGVFEGLAELRKYDMLKLQLTSCKPDNQMLSGVRSLDVLRSALHQLKSNCLFLFAPLGKPRFIVEMRCEIMSGIYPQPIHGHPFFTLLDTAIA